MLRQIREQSLALFAQMKPHQRVTFVALALMVLVPFAWLIMNREETGYEPLQWGAAFDREVLMQAEQALIDRNLNDFKTVGQRIVAPASKVEEYNGALAAAGIWSPHARGELEKVLETTSVFTPKDQFDARLRMMLQQEIRRVLRNIDGIQDADVIWARSESRTRGASASGVTAAVHVTPRPGRELSPSLIETLRGSVAGMIPDLKREAVTIVDRSTGQSWTGSNPGDPFDNKLEEKKRKIIQDHTNYIRSKLEEMIPGVVVAVNVEFDNLLSSRERSQQIEKQTVELTSLEQKRTATSSDGPAAGTPGIQSNQPRDLSTAPRQTNSQETDSTTRSFAVPSMTVTEREYVASAPKSFQVAVSIPEEHYEKLVLMDGLVPGATDQEKADFRKAVEAKRNQREPEIKRFVGTLVPAGSPPEAITVTSHRSIEREVPQTTLPLTEVVRDVVTKWGSSMALAAFAGWALLILKKSMPVSQSADSAKVLEKLTEAVKPPVPSVSEEDNQPKSSRDYLKMDVQNDPAAAADILAKWLQRA